MVYQKWIANRYVDHRMQGMSEVSWGYRQDKAALLATAIGKFLSHIGHGSLQTMALVEVE
jgi:hypothetical protein